MINKFIQKPPPNTSSFSQLVTHVEDLYKQIITYDNISLCTTFSSPMGLYCDDDDDNPIHTSFHQYSLLITDINCHNYTASSSNLTFLIFLIVCLLECALEKFNLTVCGFDGNHFVGILIKCKCLKILI